MVSTRTTRAMTGSKRPSESIDSHEQSDKRRSPYATRACDACRKRKGKCSGCQPCEFCSTRNIQCCYSAPSNAFPTIAASIPGMATGWPQSDMQWTPESVNSLTQLITNLQGQLGHLVSQSQKGHMQQQTAPIWPAVPMLPAKPVQQDVENTLNSAVRQKDVSPHEQNINAEIHSAERQIGPNQQSPENNTSSDKANTSRRKSRRFYGPTSPEYSLNVARLRMQRVHNAAEVEDTSNPLSVESSDSESDNLDEESDDEDAMVSSKMSEKLVNFKQRYSQREAIRLLDTYQEIHNELYPVVDIDALKMQLQKVYNRCPPAAFDKRNTFNRHEQSVDGDTLLILNLVITIAECAGNPNPQTAVEQSSYPSYRQAVNTKLASPTSSIKRAVIALLVGIYHYFIDKPRVAWRMCGTAGQMLMELGIHNREGYGLALDSDDKRKEVTAVTCSTFVLDHQWSMATGLPTHFPLSLFQQATEASSIQTPYLRAMVSFIGLSDKFSRPLSQFGAKTSSHMDEDAFEVMSFQIEQWRRKSVGRYNLSEFSTTGHDLLSPMPSWAILLNLRASAAHAMLLRPLFLTRAPSTVAKNNLQPALDLVTDMINILCCLDETTEIYRKQHPYYNHLLNSASALLMLIAAYAEQHQRSLNRGLSDGIATTISHNFKKAYRMATSYKSTSRASCALWKRLALMKEPLYHLGIISSDFCFSDTQNSNPTTYDMGVTAAQASAVHEAHIPTYTPRANNVTMQPPMGPSETVDNMVAGVGSMGTYVNDFNFGGYTGAILGDWPLGDMNTFFSEAGF